MVFIEPEESIKEKNRRLVSLMNRIMNISDNKLPALKEKKGQLDAETFKRILVLVRSKDIKFYEELDEFLKERRNVDNLVRTLIYAKMQTQAYTIDSDKIVYI